MRIEIINLETKILDNKYYLMEYYENIEDILEQITTILDFGMSNKTIEKWFRLNRESIKIIETLLEDKVKTLC